MLPLQSRITCYRTSYEDTLAEVRIFYKTQQPLPTPTAGSHSSSVHHHHPFRWNTLPPSLHMHYGDDAENRTKRFGPTEIKKNEAREQRKRDQCAAFAEAVEAFNLPDGSVIVDFGSGSCGLTLPLAFFLPHLQFIAVDLKEKVEKRSPWFPFFFPPETSLSSRFHFVFAVPSRDAT